MDWTTISPALISLVSSIAAEDVSEPLVPGNVTWFGRDVPFICPDTQAGIYLRITSQGARGRPGRTYSTVTVGGRQMVRETRVGQERVTLQIQVKSLDATDETRSQVWISRIRDRIWDRSVTSYLRRLGLAIIEVKPTIEVRDEIDNREIYVVSLDLLLQIVNTVQGIPVDFIAHVGLSGQVTGSIDDPLTVPEFSV